MASSTVLTNGICFFNVRGCLTRTPVVPKASNIDSDLEKVGGCHGTRNSEEFTSISASEKLRTTREVGGSPKRPRFRGLQVELERQGSTTSWDPWPIGPYIRLYGSEENQEPGDSYVTPTDLDIGFRFTTSRVLALDTYQYDPSFRHRVIVTNFYASRPDSVMNQHLAPHIVGS
jgi:hypothetical protein